MALAGHARAHGIRDAGAERRTHTHGGLRGLGARLSATHPIPSHGSDGLHVVGGEHAGVARTLHRAVHPSVVNLLHVDDGVAVLEGDLVFVSRVVIVDGAETLLWGERGSVGTDPHRDLLQMGKAAIHEGGVPGQGAVPSPTQEPFRIQEVDGDVDASNSCAKQKPGTQHYTRQPLQNRSAPSQG